MSPACYTCKICKRKGHLAKDCPESRRQEQGDNGEGSSADLLLVEEEEEDEGDGASGFNDIIMIFDDGKEEEDGEENSSKNSDEVTEDPRSEKNPNVERYACSASCHAHKSIAIASIGHHITCDKYAVNLIIFLGL